MKTEEEMSGLWLAGFRVSAGVGFSVGDMGCRYPFSAPYCNSTNIQRTDFGLLTLGDAFPGPEQATMVAPKL